ncbi:P-type conjugative transfer protein TrbJ [Hahella ganghwensis]|uniref:P-type conjugative transfer protein TrbJ n=1 Tax=Hahella ganghwensis TaxID=286420 RepID=UPI00036FB6DC
MKRINLAAKYFTVSVIILCNLATPPANAGIPVIDGTNLAQNILSALEAVSQTAKQIQQYQTQLQQYENDLQNTMAPSAFLWDRAESTINDLIDASNTLDYYKTELGSLDNYLNKFGSVAYYRGSPCYSTSGCTPAEWEAMEKNRRLASESQKKANDALFRSLDQQQNNLESDARQLQRLQSTAQSADGQLAAIQYANQFASNQSNQLLQIRGLLIAQQNATATRMQATVAKEAQEEAAAEQLRKGSYVPSPARSW